MAYTITTTFGQALFDRLKPWQNDDLAIYCDAFGAMHEEVYTLVHDQGVDGDPDYVPGYGVLFDIDTCPYKWLGYLAQFAGVAIPPGTSDTDARAMILAHQSWSRGTAEGITRAASLALTGRNLTVTTTAGSPILTSVSSTTGIQPGTLLTGAGIPATAVVASIAAGTITLTTDATASATGVPAVAKTVRLIERVGGDAYAATLITSPAETTDPAAVLAAALANKPAGILLTHLIADSPLIDDATRLGDAATAIGDFAVLTDVT
jgi:hypothetical protein